MGVECADVVASVTPNTTQACKPSCSVVRHLQATERDGLSHYPESCYEEESMESEMTAGTRLTTEMPVQPGTQSTWTIDPAHSSIEFAVRHMMFTKIRGRFKEFSGTISCLDESNPTKAKVEATIDVASIDTGDANRDAHLRSAEFLDVEHYPSITFTSKRIDKKAEDQFNMVGDLTIRGITREITLDTTYNGRGTNPWGKEVAGFSASSTLNRRDFGLTWNVALETGGMLVGDNLEVDIEVEAVKES
jgi:polyisoprenoid-binding protein YceI